MKILVKSFFYITSFLPLSGFSAGANCLFKPALAA